MERLLITKYPNRLAKSEVSLWRAHHKGFRIAMLYFLCMIVRLQFGLSWFSAARCLPYGIRAANAHNCGRWSSARRNLFRFYSLIQKMSCASFDAWEVADKEIAWWKVHDKVSELGYSPLLGALQNYYAACFHGSALLYRDVATAKLIAILY